MSLGNIITVKSVPLSQKSQNRVFSPFLHRCPCATLECRIDVALWLIISKNFSHDYINLIRVYSLLINKVATFIDFGITFSIGLIFVAYFEEISDFNELVFPINPETLQHEVLYCMPGLHCTQQGCRMALLLQSAFVSLHPGLSKASNIINFACTKLYAVAYMEFPVDQIIGKGSGSDAVSGWAGWALAHLEFGSSVNPTPTTGGRLCPPHYCLPTRI